MIKNCPFCQLEVEVKNQGAFNIHKKNCEFKQLKAWRDQANIKNKDKNNGRVHVHEWRLLDENDSQEALAIAKGYDRVCIGCDDVLKKGRN